MDKLLKDASARFSEEIKSHMKEKEPDLLAALGERVFIQGTGAKRGYSIDAVELGTRILRAWNVAFHNLLCGNGEDDKATREQIWGAFGSKEGFAGAIAAAAIIYFGVSPLVAPILAVLITQRIFGPAAEEVCAEWSKALGERK